MAGKMNFEFTFGRAGNQPIPSPDSEDPLKILILGNFSGEPTNSAGQSRPALHQRPAVRVDIDNFQAILRKTAPRMTLGAGDGSTLTEDIAIQDMEDFHPDHLCKKLPTLIQLIELRKRLLNSATFNEAAAQLRQQLTNPPVAPSPPLKAAPATPATSAEDDAATLQRILGQSSSSQSSSSGSRAVDQRSIDIEQLIGQLVQPYMVPAADPNQKLYLAAANNALTDRLRAVLHDQAFQRLESTWKSLHDLISNIEDDGQIQVSILDVSQEELFSNLPAEDAKLVEWGLFRRLSKDAGQSPGVPPWSLVIADFSFSANPNELALLGAIAATAQSLQMPIIAAGDCSLLGCPTIADCVDPTEWRGLAADSDQYWQALRRSSAAKWVGLIFPRVLLRLPYGQETDSVETFEFEEFSSARNHDNYLWGNAAYLCAGLIARSFAEDGWSMELDSQTDIGDLPAHTYLEEDEHKLQPCGEVAFGERAADAILKHGMMPLLSWRDRNAVRFLRFQSIANPMAPLAGPWS